MITAQDALDRASLNVPEISKDDLFAFHEAHFGPHATASFSTNFLKGSDYRQAVDAAPDEDWYEEDDLGYYDDGVKRTLTDEQIKIFRHSELEAFRKEQEKLVSRKSPGNLEEAEGMAGQNGAPLEASSFPQEFRGTKKKKKKSAKSVKPEPKPDLRKRTWDVVEKGLDTLDYD